MHSHVAAAAVSANALFVARAAEKNGKHLAGCVGLGRAFLPIVFTTLLGIVPKDAREYINSLFSDLYVAERLAGGSGHDANHRRDLFIMSLQAKKREGRGGGVITNHPTNIRANFFLIRSERTRSGGPLLELQASGSQPGAPSSWTSCAFLRAATLVRISKLPRARAARA